VGWVIAIAVLALLALAPWFSADSRDDEGWKPLAGGVGAAPRHVVRPFSGSPGAQAISRVTTRLAGLVHNRDGPPAEREHGAGTPVPAIDRPARH